MNLRTALRRAGDVLLTLTAVVGVVCVLLTLAGAFFGVRPLIFRSGSMSPAITTGSLGFAHEVQAADLKVGDIVSVPVGESRVTHRIVSLTQQDGAATLVLKGDANKVTDAQAYPVKQADRVWFAVPHLGAAVAWLSRAPGVYVLALYLGLMLSLAMRRRPTDSNSASPSDADAAPSSGGKRKATRSVRGRSARTVLAAGALSLIAFIGATPTWAAWADEVEVEGIQLTAGTIFDLTPHPNPCSAENGLWSSVSVKWKGFDKTGYDYRISVVNRDTGAVMGNVITRTHIGGWGAVQDYTTSASFFTDFFTGNWSGQSRLQIQIVAHLQGTNWVSPTPLKINFNAKKAFGFTTFSCV